MSSNKPNLSMPITFQKVDEYMIDDNRFTSVKCWLMHTGKNLNNSYFNKEVIEDAMPTLQYIPIVGFIEANDLNENDFSDHRYTLVRTVNGIEEKYLGSAYGVILSNDDNQAHFETKVCGDGKEREFVVCNGIIWNQFEDSANIFARDIEKGHSIELDETSVDGYEDENGCFIFTKFSFKAACVLGDSTTPAMTDSNISVNFSMDNFIKDIHRELNDKFELFNATFAKLANDKSNQGGVENMSNMDLEQVVEEQSTDFEQEAVETDVVDNTETTTEETIEEETEVVESEFTNMDAEIANIEADYEKVKADYNEMTTAFDQLKSEYEVIKANYDEMKPKYDEYVKAEEQRKADELSALKDAKFAEYEEELGDNEDFAALKEKKDEFTVDEIEKECAVIYVKAFRSNSVKFSKSESGSAIVGVFDDSDSVNDGYVHTKYGDIRKLN